MGQRHSQHSQLDSKPWQIVPGHHSQSTHPPLAREPQSVTALGSKSGFGFAGSTQHGWGPEWWGITLKQLEEVKSLPGYRSGMNARELVEEVIKPHTAMQGMGYALLKNKAQPLLVKHMVSHCWDEVYDEFVYALQQAQTEGPFWVCFVSQYQNEDAAGPSITDQLGPSLKTGPFSTVLRCVKSQSASMFAVITTTANIYERMWCIYEMYVCMLMGIPVEALIYVRSELTSNYGTHAVYSSADFLEKPVNTLAARCGNPKISHVSQDEQNIRACIQAMPGGFTEVDRAIEMLRVTCFAKRSFDPYIRVRSTLVHPDDFHPVLNSSQEHQIFVDKIGKIAFVWDRLHPDRARDPAWPPFQVALEVDGHLMGKWTTLEECLKAVGASDSSKSKAVGASNSKSRTCGMM